MQASQARLTQKHQGMHPSAPLQLLSQLTLRDPQVLGTKVILSTHLVKAADTQMQNVRVRLPGQVQPSPIQSCHADACLKSILLICSQMHSIMTCYSIASCQSHLLGLCKLAHWTYVPLLCRQSDSSLVSTATPTTVLPAASSRTNPIWNHSYYLKVGDLRVGASGSVQLAVDLRFGTKVAIKFIDRGSSRYRTSAMESHQMLCCRIASHFLWLLTLLC